MLSEPNQAKVVESLEKLEFLVCQEIFMSETAKLADVVLPATSFAEKDGTFTNTERRVQRVRKAVDPPGEAKADWEIICLMSTAMGHPLSYADAGEIFDEMAAPDNVTRTPEYKVCADRVAKAASELEPGEDGLPEELADEVMSLST